MQMKRIPIVILALLLVASSGCQPDILSREQLKQRFETGYRGFWSYIGTTDGYHFVECSVPMSKRYYFRLPVQEFPFPRTIPPSKNRSDWEPLFCTSGIVQVAVSIDRVPYYTEQTNGNEVLRIDYFATGEEKTRRRYLLGPKGQRTPLDYSR